MSKVDIQDLTSIITSGISVLALGLSLYATYLAKRALISKIIIDKIVCKPSHGEYGTILNFHLSATNRGRVDNSIIGFQIDISKVRSLIETWEKLKEENASGFKTIRDLKHTVIQGKGKDLLRISNEPFCIKPGQYFDKILFTQSFLWNEADMDDARYKYLLKSIKKLIILVHLANGKSVKIRLKRAVVQPE